jgi:hypothetical protein
MPKIHFVGLSGIACGLPFDLDVILCGNPKRVTCRNCTRTAVYAKSRRNPAKKRSKAEDSQLELFEVNK